jgi:hypothetical protein
MGQWAERFRDYAKYMRRIPGGLDEDASILDGVAVEFALYHQAPGRWPAGVLTSGRVHLWASQLQSVAAHLEECAADMPATVRQLRRVAKELQGWTGGLRSTGTFRLDEVAEPDEVDPDAPTQRMLRDALREK